MKGVYPSFKKQVRNPTSAQDSTALPTLTQSLTPLAVVAWHQGQKSRDYQLSTYLFFWLC